jgi:hypothetical protein
MQATQHRLARQAGEALLLPDDLSLTRSLDRRASSFVLRLG